VSDWFDGGGSGSPVDVGALLDSGVTDVLAGIVALGALVSIGTTSDGGALGITVTVDGRWRREYFRDAESALVWCGQAAEAVAAAIGSPRASSVPTQRKRGARGR